MNIQRSRPIYLLHGLVSTSPAVALFVFFIMSLDGCQDDATRPAVGPVTLATKPATLITTTLAMSGGTILTDGGNRILARGVVWSESKSPTVVLNTKTMDGEGTGAFTSILTGLSANKGYVARAYATTPDETFYGDEISFATPEKDTDEITAPPSSLGLSLFYKKYLNTIGLPVISSAHVSDMALIKVRDVVKKMVTHRGDVLVKLIQNKLRVGIMAPDEVTTDMPEHSDLNAIYPATNWNLYRGLGATLSRPLSSCAEENVLCLANDPYFNEDIFIHEFSHGIHYLGIRYVDTGFDAELEKTFQNARSKGLWDNTYAGSNATEYFAEGVQSWFNVNAESIPANGIHNHVNTRAELKIYDAALYNIIKRYFPEDDDKISCHH